VVGLLSGLAGAESLVIATYNVENYGPANRMTEAGYRKDYPKPEAEKRALRSVLRALNADVVVFQEMGGAAHLDELRRDLRTEGLDYPHAALATASDADRHLAILSRRELRGVTTHTDLAFAYFGEKETVKRGLLEATVATAAGDVTIFALHLKSRFTERRDDPASAIRRAGEATAIRDRVLKRFPDPAAARFVILGDCNDSRSSKAVGFLQKRGKTEVAKLLPAADSRGETWTHAYRKEDSYTRVDQVLVSPLLFPAVRGAAARIHDGPGVREASDHRPIMVELLFEAAAK
jgi:endonuclease/exonuclease/phosphatase family metal-dependent hydrolase